MPDEHGSVRSLRYQRAKEFPQKNGGMGRSGDLFLEVDDGGKGV